MTSDMYVVSGVGLAGDTCTHTHGHIIPTGAINQEQKKQFCISKAHAQNNLRTLSEYGFECICVAGCVCVYRNPFCLNNRL